MCSTHLPIEWATLEINELTYGLPENITKIIEVYYENNRGISGVAGNVSSYTHASLCIEEQELTLLTNALV